MNKTWKMLLLSGTCACVPGIALAATPTAATSYWTGPYVGGQIGLNDASADGLDSQVSLTVGPHAGYNVALPLRALGQYSPLIVGADVFADFNGQSTHSRLGSAGSRVAFGSNVYGAEVLAGLPLGAQHQIMPYAKMGVGIVIPTGDRNGTGANFRIGFGTEYRLRSNLGVTAEYSHQDGGSITSNNFTVGMNYHFGT